MKLIKIKYTVLIMLPIVVLFLVINSKEYINVEIEKRAAAENNEYIPGSCSVFSMAIDDKVFFGNNEDYRELPLAYWVVKSTDEEYGGVYFGFKELGGAQGGVNEKGLAYDYLGLPPHEVNANTNLPDRGNIMYRIQRTCATVTEAIEFIKKHNWGGTISYQVFFADASGDAVVVGVGEDGNIKFTRRPKDKDYLLATNFNLANLKNGYDYPCWRYLRAEKYLEKINSKEELTIPKLTQILDLVHIEGGIGNTLYSQVYDLKNLEIHLYYWHQYYESHVLDVKELVKQSTGQTLIKSLFSKETIANAKKENEHYKANKIE